ncbi:MAG: CocE/NonD family hydrolase, partial [Planctomycetes bacterium]|nr:CocE/NonD family hydrolase [Planctomycetota bacterium]
MAGVADGTLVTTPKGTPVYLTIPGQKVDIRLEGYEDLKPPPSSGRTIVDSGEWLKLLSKAEHTVAIETKVMVPMRDKVKLATDVYRPEKEGKVPTVLVRTCYGREISALQYGTFFARRGYAVVGQDVRGRYDSEGTFEPMRQEEADGSDTL